MNKTEKKKIYNKFLVYHLTWGYLFLNILIAWIPSGAMIFLAIREAWMPLLVFLLVKHAREVSLIFISIISIIGGVQFHINFDGNAVMSYFYGMRDILLIVLIAELLVGKIKIFDYRDAIDVFVKTVLLMAVGEVIISNIFGTDLYKILFQLDSYYKNKGVAIELGFGLLGDRNGLPLYSPNLLCTLFAMYYFFDKRTSATGYNKYYAFFVSLFTLTKVLPLVLIYFYSNKRWLTVTIIGTLLLPIFMAIVYEIAKDNPLIFYHYSSITGHIESFSTAMSEDLTTFIPNLLGSSSHAIMNLSDNNADGLMESLLLARLSDLKLWFIFVLIYIFYIFIKLKNDLKRKAFFIFLLISLLTATSNQPVAWIPILVIIADVTRRSSINIENNKHQN